MTSKAALSLKSLNEKIKSICTTWDIQLKEIRDYMDGIASEVLQAAELVKKSKSVNSLIRLENDIATYRTQCDKCFLNSNHAGESLKDRMTFVEFHLKNLKNYLLGTGVIKEFPEDLGDYNGQQWIERRREIINELNKITDRKFGSDREDKPKAIELE